MPFKGLGENYMKGLSVLLSFYESCVQYLKDHKGSVALTTAVALPAIIGMVGLGTDMGYWMAEKRNLQTAADAGVIAAGWEVAQRSEQYMGSAALKEAVNNGYRASENGQINLEMVDDTYDSITLRMDISHDSKRFFSKFFLSDAARVGTVAEARISGIDGRFCILSLEKFDADSTSTFGSVVIDAPDCGIAVNSSDESAFSMTGSSEVTINDIRIVGGYDIGNNADLTYNTLRTGQTALADPYADLEMPELDACDYNKAKVNSSSTLSPGTYCGGLSISGNTDVEFEPGVYIIEGDNFKVTGGGSLYGDGVTFLFTGSGSKYAGMDISGSRNIEFNAPQTGEDWGGVLFFQDRNAPTDDHYQNKLTGSGDVLINGVGYFPSQGLHYGGTSSLSSSDAACTKLIARTVTLAGNPLLGNNCNDYDPNDIGLPIVKLVK